MIMLIPVIAEKSNIKTDFIFFISKVDYMIPFHFGILLYTTRNAIIPFWRPPSSTLSTPPYII